MRVMRDVKSGAVLEKEIYFVPENIKLTKKTEPKDKKELTPEEKSENNRKKSEKNFVRIFNNNFDKGSWYLTFTFDDEHLPLTWEEASRIADNYLRRVKRWDPSVKYLLVIGRGRGTDRLHVHAIIDGTYIDDVKMLELWTDGTIKRAEHLREHNFYDGVDCGQDFTGLAVYLHKHNNAEHKGKRWKQSRNLIAPTKDKPRETKREYKEDKPPRAPEGYKFVGCYQSNYQQGGYISFKYVREIKNSEAAGASFKAL